MFSLIILKLNNELCEEQLKLLLMVSPYNFMSERVLGNKYSFPDNNEANQLSPIQRLLKRKVRPWLEL
jgi:hypothetical protein